MVPANIVSPFTADLQSVSLDKPNDLMSTIFEDISTLDDIKFCDDGLSTPSANKQTFNHVESLPSCSETESKLSEDYGSESSLPWPLCIAYDHKETRKEFEECWPFNGYNEEDDLGRKKRGKTDSNIAKELRYYIEDLAKEDEMTIDLNELVGPCGSPSCSFVKNLKDFIFHRGVFAYNPSDDKKHCTCTKQMEEALTKRDPYNTTCTQECEDLNSIFNGGKCSSNKSGSISRTTLTTSKTEQLHANESSKTIASVRNTQSAYYVMVKLDKPLGSASESKLSSSPQTSSSATSKIEPSKSKICSSECPKSYSAGTCSKSACDIPESNQILSISRPTCSDNLCPNKETDKEAYTPSPADSDVEINLAELRNLCSVKSCKATEQVIEYIMKGIVAKNKCSHEGKDSCFCDCCGAKK